MNESIFLVEREDYKALVERLKVEKIRTEKVEERELLLFYEMPVQEVFGSVEEASTSGTGSISGGIFTAKYGKAGIRPYGSGGRGSFFLLR